MASEREQDVEVDNDTESQAVAETRSGTESDTGSDTHRDIKSNAGSYQGSHFESYARSFVGSDAISNVAGKDGFGTASGSRCATPSSDDVRRALYRSHTTVHVAPGMVNQIERNGLLTKKTIDGRKVIRMFDAEGYIPDNRTHTPNGSLIIHLGDVDPNPDTCPAFIHPPYGFSGEYRAEYDMMYDARINLDQLGDAAKKCGFCSILYQGIWQNTMTWIGEWAEHRWVDAHPDIPFSELDQLSQGQPWVVEYWDEISGARDIDTTKILLYIGFPKGNPYVHVRLMVKPWDRDKSFRPRNRPLGDLEFYTQQDARSPWAAFGPAPHVHPFVLSNECIRMMRNWIRDCCENHSNCKTRMPLGLPSRLLRISTEGTQHDTLALKVCLEDTDPNKAYHYATLSHVWYFTTPLKTTRENIDQHRARVPLEDLSTAIVDTFYVAKYLNLDYVWIDSLCIVQDDIDDWTHESPHMGMIYGNSYVTLVAHGPSLGIRKDTPRAIRDSLNADDPPVYCRQQIDHAHMFSHPINNTSWYGRGWCMQERLFSPRLLHFGGTAEEVSFECSTHIRCECNRISSVENSSLKTRITRCLDYTQEMEDTVKAKDELWKVYIYACEDYTARGLSFTGDTLPAISSFMSQFSPQLGRYYAGIWEHNFLISLQWEAFDTGESSRHETYIAPSWSWASRAGAVIWYMHEDKFPNSNTHDFAELLEVACAPRGADPYGAVTNGHIRLRGFVMEMMINDTTKHYPDDRLEMTRAGAEDECYVTLDAKQDIEVIEPGQTVICLDLMRDKATGTVFSSGLVLLPVDGTDCLHRRIGFSTMLTAYFSGSSIQEITIV